MVFARKIKSKKKEYWALIHSIRKGKKIIQKSRYIGKILPPEARLNRLKKEFLKELQEPKYAYLSAEDTEKIEAKRCEYRREIKKLNSSEKEEHLKEFIIRFTYDSSKLAGVPVTLRQTFLILREGIIPKGLKRLRTARELENHEKGVIAITQYRGKLDIRFMKKLHRILFTGIDDTIAGKLRSELKKDVKIAGTSYMPPKWQELNKELAQFFKWYSSVNRRWHPLELAALMHVKLISMQPFTDGNSRLARLLMNWVLWKKRYPMIDIPIEDIENYYNALDKYQI